MVKWTGKFLAATAIIVAAAFVFLKFSPAIPISSVVTNKDSLFTVSGTGKVTVVPDTGLVQLGININRTTIKAAQTEVNSVMEKIVTALKDDLSIPDKDIQTSQYSVYPNYDYQSGTNRITGYHVSTSLSVTVRELDKVNQVIDTATQFGANNIGGIQFTVDEDRQKALLQEARDKAVAEAKAKAQSLAQAAGISLGRIVNIQESTDSSRDLYMLKTAAVPSGMGGGAETDIQPGSTDISSTVTLFYDIR